MAKTTPTNANAETQMIQKLAPVCLVLLSLVVEVPSQSQPTVKSSYSYS
jgi:hypothetical protein